MQETRNSCFGSKKHSTTLLQARTGKQEYQNVTATYLAVTFRHSCLPVFAGRSFVVFFFAFKLLDYAVFIWKLSAFFIILKLLIWQFYFNFFINKWELMNTIYDGKLNRAYTYYFNLFQVYFSFAVKLYYLKLDNFAHSYASFIFCLSGFSVIVLLNEFYSYGN